METTIDYNAVADNLDRAADLLWMYGRCQNVGLNDEGQMCVLGAVARAKGEERVWEDELADYDLHTASVLCPASPESLALEWFIGTHRELATLVAYPNVEGGAFKFFAMNWGVVGRKPYILNDSLALTPENDALIVDTIRRTAKAVRACEQNG